MKLFIFRAFLILLAPLLKINAGPPLQDFKVHNQHADEFLKASTAEKLLKIPHSSPLGKDKFSWQHPMEFAPSPITGYYHPPNTQIRHIERYIDYLIYDVIYTFDQFGRRINLFKPNKSHKYFVSFYGCSFTYGNGLNDNETINHHFNNIAQSKKIYAYNYAIGASGPHMMLALLKNGQLKKQISFSKGHYIYIYNDFHLGRANIFMHEMSWLKDTPYFEHQNGEFKNVGTFAENNPWTMRLYYIMTKFHNMFAISRNFPKAMDKHYQYFCDIISESKKTFKAQFPDSQFHVYIHPFSKFPFPIKQCLQRNNISFYRSNIRTMPKHYIPRDGHPSSSLNKLISQEILGYLEK